MYATRIPYRNWATMSSAGRYETPADQQLIPNIGGGPRATVIAKKYRMSHFTK